MPLDEVEGRKKVEGKGRIRLQAVVGGADDVLVRLPRIERSPGKGGRCLENGNSEIIIFFGMESIKNLPKERSKRKNEEKTVMDRGVRGFWADLVGG